MIDKNDKNSELLINIPVLPLRDMIVYPNIISPLFVGREKSIKCLEISINNNKQIMLLAQKSSFEDSPKIDDLFKIGTISSVLQMFKLPDGTVKILVEGITRANIIKIEDNGESFVANAKHLISYKSKNIKEKGFVHALINQYENYLKLNKKIYSDILNSLNDINDFSKLVDTIAYNLPIKLIDKQKILEILNIGKRAEFLMKLLEYEIELLQIEKKIRNRIRKQMDKSQREYYLNEQIKAIQKELGEINNINDEYENLKKKISLSKMPKEIEKKTENELQKLKMMSPISAEATVIRSYIDWMISVPWKKKSKLKKNLDFAQNVLNNDHYGLYKIKEHILEYLAVQNRVNKIKGPILCLVGPPGVGKTSLGKSIAKATGRKYTRISLGGIKDEAEIRGHRRTYIGSMPGKLIQKISRIGVKNPLFLLDEIDKMSFDIRGDPASALLEVLDPEQNIYFNDHYLEVDYDLSDVMFVATSNSINNIPMPLLDRMEIIKLSGYSEEEKINIANKHLLLKQIKINGLKNSEINIDNSALLSIIRYYTREAGVRNLEREISKICRKSIKLLLINKELKNIEVNENNIKNFLGIKKFDFDKVDNINKIGQTIGLAWTEFGGELLTIESICIPGKGKLIYTGSLGEVMKESIKASLTLIKSKTDKLGIKYNFYETNDIHVHVPEGAIPKDGPSAGIAICISIISCLTKIPIKCNMAMTGEITLMGKVLPIGGLKEKILAAKRGGVKYILIPKDNIKELEDMSKNDILDLNIYGINSIEEVISLSLCENLNNIK